MSDEDDPIAFLNLQEEPSSQPGRDGGFWIASILALVLCIGLGFAIAFSAGSSESNWFGALVGIAGGVLVGSIASVALAVASFARREKHAPWGLLAAVPGGIVILGALGSLLEVGISKYQSHVANAQRVEATASIQADPEIVLREHWDKASNNQWRYSAYQRSFGDPQVHYSLSQLQRIYDEAPAMRDYLFRHPACTPEFLAAHFQEAWDRCPKFSYDMLANLVANPNTPLELVEKVAQAKKLPAGAVDAAKRALAARAKR